MRAFSAVGINNNLTTSQACIAVRATDNELSGRIYKVFYVVVEQCQHLLRLYLRLHAWHQYVQNVLSNLCQHTQDYQ